MKAEQKFCAVVKADAYGLGARKICAEIDELVDYFAVSSEEEFFEISGIVKKPILLLDPVYENITKLAKAGCEFCVSNLTQMKLLLILAKKKKEVLFKIHLAFNTGMNRFGFNLKEEVLECFNLFKKTQNVSIIGVFSHFYAGNNKIYTKKQSRRLGELKSFLLNKVDVDNLIFPSFPCTQNSAEASIACFLPLLIASF